MLIVGAVKAVPRSAPHSSQGLKEKIIAQHVKSFNALSPSDKRSGHSSRRLLVRARSRHRAGCAAQCGRDQLTHFEGSAPWLPTLCWKRDVSRGAAVLVSGGEGAQAFFVLCAYEKKANSSVVAIVKVPALLYLR